MSWIINWVGSVFGAASPAGSRQDGNHGSGSPSASATDVGKSTAQEVPPSCIGDTANSLPLLARRKRHASNEDAVAAAVSNAAGARDEQAGETSAERKGNFAPRKRARTESAAAKTMIMDEDFQTVRTGSAVVSLVAELVRPVEHASAAPAAGAVAAGGGGAPAGAVGTAAGALPASPAVSPAGFPAPVAAAASLAPAEAAEAVAAVVAVPDQSHNLRTVSATPVATRSLATANASTPQVCEIREQFAEFDVDGDGMSSSYCGGILL